MSDEFTIEAEILQFVSTVWGLKSMEMIGLKAGEEAGEIMGAIVKISEGRAALEHLDEEIGDLLIVLSQLAAKRGTTLQELRARRYETIKTRNRK